MRVLAICMCPPSLDRYGGVGLFAFQTLLYRPSWVNLALIYYSEPHREEESSSERLQNLLGLTCCREIKRAQGVHKTIGTFKSTLMSLPKEIKSYQPYGETARVIREVLENFKPEAVWMYQAWLIQLKVLFPKLPLVISGMDSFSLLHKRRVRNVQQGRQSIEDRLVMRKAVRIEQEIAQQSTAAHFLGKPDLRAYRKVTNNACSFHSLFPQGQLVSVSPSHFTEKPLSILVSGSGSDFGSIYMKTELEGMTRSLVPVASFLSGKVRFIFAGINAKRFISALSEAGMECEELGWNPDNQAYLQKLSISPLMINPLRCGGGGIKSRVLQALGSGVAVLGSRYSFENLPHQNGKSYRRYRYAEEIGACIIEIESNRAALMKMSLSGKEMVQNLYQPSIRANDFWNGFQSSIIQSYR